MADVTKAENVEHFVSGAAEKLGGVDALICTVGGTVGGASECWFLRMALEWTMATRRESAAAQEKKGFA